jgi:hypothetical protein
MKTAIIITIIFLAVLVFVQVYANKSSEGTEQQQYDIIESDGVFEFRFYPAATMASVTVPGDYRNSSGTGFRILASYIFGGNSTDQKIAMTAPVHMTRDTEGYSMSFVMPSGYDTTNLPLPNSAMIRLHESEPAYTATIRFSGFANEEKIEDHKQKLMAYLDQRKIMYSEPFTYLGFNPPYQLINRRNEIMVRIEYPSDQSD